MKRVFTLLFLFAYCFVEAQENPLVLSSKIKKVTVFLQGAQVTRQSQISLQAGTSALVLKGISPNIEEESIQVQGSDRLKILSVSFNVNYLESINKSERILSLENEHERISTLIKKEESLLGVYKEEQNILVVNKSIGGSEQGIHVEELKAAMDYFRTRLLDISQKLLEIESKLKQYKEELVTIESQQKELKSVKGQPTGEILVKVSSPSSVMADFKVTYLVRDAKWYPSYDIRAKDINSPINVSYKANLSQQSGEDWNDVELTISSANPSASGAKPVIKPWILGFHNSVNLQIRGTSSIYGSRAMNSVKGRITDGEGQPMPGANIIIKGTTLGTTTDANGFYELPFLNGAQSMVVSFIGYVPREIPINDRDQIDVALTEDVTQLSETVVTGYASGIATSSYEPRLKKVLTATPVVRQTTIEFTLDEPFTVKSDGEMRTSEMIEYELDAQYEYYTAPKIALSAFLTAKILRWDEYNFMDGEASLYFEGKYIGKSIIDAGNTNDTLTLSLGRDPAVLVKREKVKDLSSKQFVGSNQKVVYAYNIEIRNSKRQPVTIVIEDQMPIPNTKEIEVDKQEYAKGELDNENGIVKWKKVVAPGKTEKILLSYTLKFPKYSQLMLE